MRAGMFQLVMIARALPTPAPQFLFIGGML
jgi:hypothetical protein